MKRSSLYFKVILATISLILLFLSHIIFSASIMSQTTNYIVYNPTTKTGDCLSHDIPPQNYPNKWNTYTDQVFKTTIRRVTNYANDYGGTAPVIQYTTFSCGNSDGSKVLFTEQSETKLFYNATTGAFLRRKYFGPLSYGDLEFRWSHITPSLGFYRNGTRFYSYNYDTDTSKLIRNFTDWYPTATGIETNDKGEQSWDDRYWAFRVETPGYNNGDQAQYIVVYDKTNDTKVEIDLIAYYKSRGFTGVPQPRWVTMSPAGKYVIVMFTNGGSRGEGHTTLFLRGGSSLTWARDLCDFQSGHPAWGYDIHGNEVFYFWADGRLYMVPLDVGLSRTINLFQTFNGSCNYCTDSIYWSNMALGADYHFSTCYNIPGWVFITHAMNDTTTFNQCWTKRELFAVRASSNLSEVLVLRIAHHRGASTGNYNDQSRAQISQDGKYIYYDSNWLGTQNREIFRAELPNMWWDQIAAIIPITPNLPPNPPTGLKIVGN